MFIHYFSIYIYNGWQQHLSILGPMSSSGFSYFRLLWQFLSLKCLSLSLPLSMLTGEMHWSQKIWKSLNLPTTKLTNAICISTARFCWSRFSTFSWSTAPLQHTTFTYSSSSQQNQTSLIQHHCERFQHQHHCLIGFYKHRNKLKVNDEIAIGYLI